MIASNVESISQKHLNNFRRNYMNAADRENDLQMEQINNRLDHTFI